MSNDTPSPNPSATTTPPIVARRTMLQAAFAAFMPFGSRRPPGNRADTPPGGHPVPRPGVTAAKILPARELEAGPETAAIFDQIREIPAVADGIRCQCSCADLPEYYSLLTCFEGPDAMARHCEMCQAEGRLVSRLHRSGRTLDQIRKAIDARFG